MHTQIYQPSTPPSVHLPCGNVQLQLVHVGHQCLQHDTMPSSYVHVYYAPAYTRVLHSLTPYMYIINVDGYGYTVI